MSAAHRLARNVVLPIGITFALALPSANTAFASTGWEEIPTVHVGGAHGQDFLSGVAVSSTGGAFAVGEFLDASDQSHSLMLQWNGSAWHQVSTPNPGGISGQSTNALEAAAAASDGSVYAVGKWWSASASGPFLMRRQNGSWVRDAVASPYTELYGVSALNASEAWAVGNDHYRATSFHWNGSTWTKVSVPYPGGTVGLAGVVEISAHDVWAAGSVENGDGPFSPFLVHWDGHSWTRATHIHVQGALNGITARNTHDVWAVGGSGFGPGEVPIALHFNGQSWAATSPVRILGGDANTSLAGAAVVGKHKVWAVGEWDRDTQVGTHALIEQWDGSSWSRVTVPALDPSELNDRVLTAIAQGGGNLWAVGYGGANGLTLRRP
jgi:hypothetical protein